MIIVRTSILTGSKRKAEIDVTELQESLWKSGKLNPFDIKEITNHIGEQRSRFFMLGITNNDFEMIPDIMAKH